MSIDEPIPTSISSAELETCIKVLRKFNANDGYPSIDSNEYETIRPLVHNLYHIGTRLNRKRNQDNRRQAKVIDRKAKNSCLLRSGRAQKLQQLQLEHILVPDGVVEIESPINHTPQRLIQSHNCYICKLKYRTLHFFYDRLCPACAKLNYEKRLQTTDLTNNIALVTGGRVKIGYRVVLKLLRANCFVITTTRFPMDFLNRLNKEQDFEEWKDRVHIYGVDFRYSQLIEFFTEMLIEKYHRLDFIINNACQTIRRPNEYYQHLINHERLTNYSLLPIDQQNILDGNLQFYQRLAPLSNQLQNVSSTLSLPSINNTSEQTSTIIPHISFDVNQQPIDLCSTNSWLLRLADLSTSEITEVLTINTLAPFILNSKLKTLMTDKHPNPDSIKFIINVSAMEGSFSRLNKTDRHPHTNAAKAALNMMTRTSAIDYKQSNIYMVSVDTGWINDENPLEKAMKSMINRDFQTPLDEEDAAARILDPIIDTYKQLAEGKTDINIPYGRFLKDYNICDW
jgi:NAD(P)-dependent dehydrogenase (short-subunit alcohol dehydrogenase family)